MFQEKNYLKLTFELYRVNKNQSRKAYFTGSPSKQTELPNLPPSKSYLKTQGSVIGLIIHCQILFSLSLSLPLSEPLTFKKTVFQPATYSFHHHLLSNQAGLSRDVTIDVTQQMAPRWMILLYSQGLLSCQRRKLGWSNVIFLD